MTMKLIGLLAETPIHVGIGQANTAIDLPIAREATTHIPHVPGSGAKGALRVWAKGAVDNVDTLFGQASGDDDGNDGGAGTILCGEMRLALLPVRTLSGSYKYVTCPLIINRLLRDLRRAEMPAKDEGEIQDTLKMFDAKPENAIDLSGGTQTISLEEREFTPCDLDGSNIKSLLNRLTTSDLNNVVVLKDDDFSWFAQNALPVVMRNSLDENKRVKSGALWSEEMLPTDTVMWMVLGQRTTGTDDLDTLTKAIENKPYIQVGGNETIGQGWLQMQVMGGENDA